MFVVLKYYISACVTLPETSLKPLHEWNHCPCCLSFRLIHIIDSSMMSTGRFQDSNTVFMAPPFSIE